MDSWIRAAMLSSVRVAVMRFPRYTTMTPSASRIDISTALYWSDIPNSTQVSATPISGRIKKSRATRLSFFRAAVAHEAPGQRRQRHQHRCQGQREQRPRR